MAQPGPAERGNHARLASLGVAILLAAAQPGCTTVAEHRKLEERVIDMDRAMRRTGLREQVADYVAEIDSLRDEIRALEGRMEVAEQMASEARLDARKARSELAQVRVQWQGGDGSPPGTVAPGSIPDDLSSGGPGGDRAPAADSTELSEEIRAYRAAHAAWRENETAVCIDRFRKFLQTYPASPYADDAAYWMADCHYKQADYKNAVLRFDDVVRNYPTGNKAPDALYRQGESLLKLGPGFREAAKRAFERVIKEYPDSARALEARRQLEASSAG